MKGKKLTHTDEAGNPGMVDVSSKAVTHRVARAEGTVILGKEIMQLIKDQELQTRKGPVFQTAIIAGVMAAKRTADLIPLTHPIPLEDCKIRIEPSADRVIIHASASIGSKTGVEMEALTAVSVAALTIYDMCKALSHDIVITDIRLIEKTGGKKNYKRD
ncbi:MAG: cyclic pyranopterin monophosphate synthase MoaC [Cyclobacteriaceae bacterium]|jgi:cyclic pyranopterin phosphate synthase|nr:cyclic pyranopterin monophosphate synthase MoaC [Cyclobacteriaceae bacterium]